MPARCRELLRSALPLASPRAVALAVLVAAMSLGPNALGQPTRRERADELARAGTLAYSVGKYAFAIQAFQQAHELTERPPLLFLIAQAYRQRYLLASQRHDLAQAVAHYQRYLASAPDGGRRAEALAALRALGPALEGAALDDAELVAAAAAGETVARVAVTSPTLGAVARIDGGPAEPLPLFVELPPGKHRFAVRAPGYFERVYGLLVVEGGLYPLDLALEPKPAKLAIDGPVGADVHVDGKLVGTTPLPSPLEVNPGPHFVAVTLDGHESYALKVRVARGELIELYADLAVTDQRIASGLIIGAGGAGLVTGIVLGVLSVVEQRRASDILEQAEGGALGVESQREHVAALAAADDYRVASGAITGIALAAFVVGGVLFVLDEPAVPARAGDGRDDPEGAEASVESAASRRLVLSAAPELGPTFGGATIRLRF